MAEIAKKEAFAAGYKLLAEGDGRISHDSGLNLGVETFPPGQYYLFSLLDDCNY